MGRSGPGPVTHRRRTPRDAVAVRCAAALVVAGTAAVMVLYRMPGEDAPTSWMPPPLPTPSSAGPSAPPRTLAAPAPAIRFPERGAGTWSVAPGRGRAPDGPGTLLHYRVAVERGIAAVDSGDFADEVDGILADPRSWTGTGRWRLHRAGPDETADFTIYLATPATRDVLCARGYDRYTSCRNGDKVVLNVARWAGGAAAFDADLPTYRRYLVNHEVGHRLGQHHQRCPGRGRPAPVMQQQTLGLHGCRPQPWPLPDGEVYEGPPGEYDDSPPRDTDR